LRFLAEEAAKATPFGGDLVSGAIAAASTWSIGQVAIEYYEGGRSLSRAQIREMFTRFYRRYRSEGTPQRSPASPVVVPSAAAGS
jgi:uncharacterized protein (DUF697 family)